MSDSHGRGNALESIYQTHPNADYYIHLGDGWADAAALQRKYPHIQLISIRGNCDLLMQIPETATLSTLGGDVFCTHGHLFSVKTGLARLLAHAKQCNAAVVLFGHTHRPFYSYQSGIHLLNPGCAEWSDRYRFGIVDLFENGIVCSTASIAKQLDK